MLLVVGRNFLFFCVILTYYAILYIILLLFFINIQRSTYPSAFFFWQTHTLWNPMDYFGRISICVWMMFYKRFAACSFPADSSIRYIFITAVCFNISLRSILFAVLIAHWTYLLSYPFWTYILLRTFISYYAIIFNFSYNIPINSTLHLLKKSSINRSR